jgi:hypothetical protein
MKCRLIILILAGISLTTFAGRSEAKVYKLYYLGGQSNMDGHGRLAELPAELNTRAEGVLIFHGNSAPDGGEVDGRGIWAVLQPGHGGDFESDGKENTYLDKWHYDGAGYIDLGKKFAEAVFRLQNQ